MKINREELAWAAGLFDGEGWIGVTFSGPYCSIKITLTQVDRKVLDRFNNATLRLGAVGDQSYNYVSRPNARPQFSFQVSKFEAVQAIIAMIYPFLSPIKQQQSISALKKYDEWYQTSRHITQKSVHSTL